jgi:hypothetical protein
MYGLTTTSNPSFQRGSGSRGSTGTIQQHSGVVVLVEKQFQQGFAEAIARMVDQREEGEGTNQRVKRLATMEEELHPSYIGGGEGSSPRGGRP